MEEIECPACAKRGTRINLQLYQINLKKAVYMCPEKLCRHPKGSKWTYVERDILKIDDNFKIENDSTDSDIEAITKLFTNRARKKIKKNSRLKSFTPKSLGTITDSDSSNDEEIIKKAYNILLGNVLKNEKDYLEAIEEHRKLIDCDMSKILSKDNVNNSISIFDTKKSTDLSISEKSLNLSSENSLNSCNRSSIFESSNYKNESMKLDNNKNDIIKPIPLYEMEENLTYKVNPDVSQSKCNDMSDIFNFDNDSNEKSTSQNLEKIENTSSQSSLKDKKIIDNAVQHSTIDISKLVGFSNDILKNATKIILDEKDSTECNNKMEQIHTPIIIENIEVSKTKDLLENNNCLTNIHKSVSKNEQNDNVENLIIQNVNACSIPVKIQVLNCDNSSYKIDIDIDQKSLIDNLKTPQVHNIDNALKQNSPVICDKDEFDIEAMPIIFEDFTNSTTVLPEKTNKSDKIATKSVVLPELFKKSDPSNILRKINIKGKNAQKVIKINNAHNNKITNEQMKALRHLLTKSNSSAKRIKFINTVDDISKIKVKNVNKKFLAKDDISAALRASGIKEDSANTKTAPKPSVVNIIAGQNTKPKSVASKFEGFSFTSKIIKPENAKSTSAGISLNSAEIPLPEYKTSDVNVKNNCVSKSEPVQKTPEKIGNLSALDDLLNDIDLNSTNLTNTDNDCGLEDVDDWLKSLVD